MSDNTTGNDDAEDVTSPRNAEADGSAGTPTANATWSRMLAGNRRFATGRAEHPWQDRETRESLIDGQHPDAAVLSCGDSRVPPEIVFDEGLGDLFVVRTAGEVLDEAVIASLEFAVQDLHTGLLVILGHEHCGAVQGAVTALTAVEKELTSAEASAAKQAPVASVSAEGSGDADRTASSDARLDDLAAAVAESDSPIIRSVGGSVIVARRSELDSTDDIERIHVARTIERLTADSEVIRQALAQRTLTIVGARYRLTDGLVEVLSY